MAANKLRLSKEKIARARKLAAGITAPVNAYIAAHTTVAVERATLRLLGADGVSASGVPVPNLVVAKLGDRCSGGAARYWVNALARCGGSARDLCNRVAEGFDIGAEPLLGDKAVATAAKPLVHAAAKRITAHAQLRRKKIAQAGAASRGPLLYVIVATGNIYEDVKQAQAAALAGADIIAVIRTTAQSLLDYVPFGATTEGFGGTYATQENFRIMRAALDETGGKERRYIRLVNYASGLCMPEIAAMGALERLDMMLNDSMYGILFRDINMYRTFVDQHFSRMISAYADIVINTGEDNYLTTSDAFEKAYTVLASQLINENFALGAGMKRGRMGLGHAFEMDPAIKNGFLYELAQAQMAREIFPESPLKYMPPTKYMTGDIFMGFAMNTLYNLVAGASDQSILLLGMLTEAIHTPFMHDRYLAIRNARYVLENTAGLSGDIAFKPGGIMQTRARTVLDKTLAFLEKVRRIGLFNAIERKMFADIGRPKNGGKGLDGVFEKSPDYWNPVETFLQSLLGIGKGRTRS